MQSFDFREHREFLVIQEGMVVKVKLENLANLEQQYVWYQDINALYYNIAISVQCIGIQRP